MHSKLEPYYAAGGYMIRKGRKKGNSFCTGNMELPGNKNRQPCETDFLTVPL